MQAEIVLTGGAAILACYRFRDATTDVDAIILAASSIKDAINHVGDRYGLPAGWLNEEFLHTESSLASVDGRSRQATIIFYALKPVKVFRL